MSLGKIAPPHRTRLRWHGWLLAAWVFAVGWVASWALLRLGVTWPMVRWPLAMLAMYGMGFIGGCYFYVRWRQGGVQAGDVPERADLPEEIAYDEDGDALRRRMDWLANAIDIGTLAEVFPPLWVVVVPLVAIALAIVLAILPWLATEMLAGFLAELILEFVIGAVVMRRVLRPRPLEESPMSVAARTWWMGLLAVVIAGAAGYGAQQAAPQAVTLGQVLQGLR